MKNSRTIAGINNNQVSSTFQLDNSCEFDLNSNLFFTNIPTSNKRSSSIHNKSTKTQSSSFKSSYQQLDFDDNSCNSNYNSDSSSHSNNSSPDSENINETNTQLVRHSNQSTSALLSTSTSESTSQQESADHQSNPIDITVTQHLLSKHYSSLTFTPIEHILMDLFHILKASNTPMIVFDHIISWVTRHDQNLKRVDVSNLPTRNIFITDLNRKLYQDQIFMKPIVNPISLSSGRTTNVVTFSFKEMILDIITNQSLFCPDNLLLDPQNPCAPQPESDYYGEVNTGTWWKQAIQNECKEPNHILMPFCHFIDGLQIDKYGKLSVEAVLTCCLWFNRRARNRSST